MAIQHAYVVGAVICNVFINQHPAIITSDTSSGISLIFVRYVENYNNWCCGWDPSANSGYSNHFCAVGRCRYLCRVSWSKTSPNCSIVCHFPYDLSLGVGFVRHTSFLIDFSNLLIINPEVSYSLTAPL